MLRSAFTVQIGAHTGTHTHTQTHTQTAADLDPHTPALGKRCALSKGTQALAYLQAQLEMHVFTLTQWKYSLQAHFYTPEHLRERSDATIIQHQHRYLSKQLFLCNILSFLLSRQLSSWLHFLWAEYIWWLWRRLKFWHEIIHVFVDVRIGLEALPQWLCRGHFYAFNYCKLEWQSESEIFY